MSRDKLVHDHIPSKVVDFLEDMNCEVLCSKTVARSSEEQQSWSSCQYGAQLEWDWTCVCDKNVQLYRDGQALQPLGKRPVASVRFVQNRQQP